MKAINQGWKRAIPWVFLSVIILSCASIPELNLHYQLSQERPALEGREVALSFQDVRESKDFLGPGAKEALANFPGNLSLSIAPPNDPGFKIGLFSPYSVFKKGFQHRLENAGLKIAPPGADSAVPLNVILKEFRLDLVDRKWRATLGYEANLGREGGTVATQAISGKAERLKVLTDKGADEVLGEVFTDSLNRLDVLGLFEQAALLSTARREVFA